MAIFCCWGVTRVKSRIDGNICGAAIQMALKRFHWSQRVDIDKYLERIESINLTWKTPPTLCKNPWRVYRLLTIFSASGFLVIIKFQPATCKIYLPVNLCTKSNENTNIGEIQNFTNKWWNNSYDRYLKGLFKNYYINNKLNFGLVHAHKRIYKIEIIARMCISFIIS